jgi:hypothetical protein
MQTIQEVMEYLNYRLDSQVYRRQIGNQKISAPAFLPGLVKDTKFYHGHQLSLQGFLAEKN